MAKRSLIYKVFIASPSDVKDEVKVLIETIYRWNTINSDKYGVFLNPSNWKTDSFPEMGNDPQKILNRQIVDTADILIGVFWNRLGTPTTDAPSGTVEEIENFIGKGKPTLLYFSSRSIDPYSIDQLQFSKVKEIKQKYINQGIIWEFSEISEFKEQVFRHLSATVAKIAEDEKTIYSNIKNEKTNISRSIHKKSDKPDNSSPVREVLISSFENIEKTVKDKQAGISTGFNDLDLLIPEIPLGSILLFSGYIGVGKTSFLRSLCLNLTINKKIHSAIFSVDGNKSLFINYLLCSMAGIDPHDLRTGNLRKSELPKISFAAGPISEAPLILIDDLNITLDKITDLIKKLSEKGTKVIFIDNLHMVEINQIRKYKKDFSDLFRSLKILANDTNVVIIIFCSINQSTIQTDSIPNLYHLQQYGDIASFADIIGFLCNNENETEDRKLLFDLIIGKNQFGPIGRIHLSFDSKCLRFGDYPNNFSVNGF